MKGMDEYFDMEAESSERGNNSEENVASEEAARDMSDTPGGRDEGIRSPLPKHHRTSQGRPSHGRKKTVRCTIQTTIIRKGEAVQLATDLLTIVLQPILAQEDVSTNPPAVTSVPNEPTPVHTDKLPSTSRIDALIGT